MEFKSQICTTREQSERLLSLGIKKETADMLYKYIPQWDDYVVVVHDWINYAPETGCIPAWSLCRLLELCRGTYLMEIPLYINDGDWSDLYEWLIDFVDCAAQQLGRGIDEDYFEDLI